MSVSHALLVAGEICAGGGLNWLFSSACSPLSQVLDEIGVDLAGGLVSAPKQRVAAGQRQQQAAQEDAEADELAMRLAALK